MAGAKSTEAVHAHSRPSRRLPSGPGPLRIEELDLPDPGPHQVVVKQLASGVCHSQLHQMHGPRAQQQLLGHESTGIVLAAGSEVSHVREGDRVMVTWVVRDPDAARPPVPASLTLGDGSVAQSQNTFTWADHTIADEQYVVAMPDDAPTDVTAIIGCAVMTGAGPSTTPRACSAARASPSSASAASASRRSPPLRSSARTRSSPST